MSSDFYDRVTRYKLKKLKVVKVCRRAADLFALEFVLGLTSNKTHRRVYNQLALFRKLWSKKLKSLVSNYLWMPNTRLLDPQDPQFDMKKFELTFRRTLFCRPTFVHYMWRGDKVFRPCNRSHFCPFCFSRTITYLYRRLKRRINKLAEKNSVTQLLFTVYIVRRFVYASNFDPLNGCHPLQIDLYVEQLQEEIAAHRKAHIKKAKLAQRNTLGSMWRLFVLPTDAGWIVESRQCFIHMPNKTLPAVELENSVVHYLRTAAITECADIERDTFFRMFGEFCRYPLGFLYGYPEFVAAYLRAAHGIRLSSGTGILKVTSRRLWRIFKLEREHEKANKEFQTAIAVQPGEQEKPQVCPVRHRPDPAPSRVPV
jgi:hypothetical protein